MDHHKLIKDCLKGIPHAQEELYNCYAEVMFAVCYRYTKSVKDAEDVLQEGFVNIFSNLHQYRFEGELGAWIRQVMVRAALRYLKKHRRYSDELTYEDSSVHPVCEDNPLVILQAKELADLIRQLPTGYQTIFNLHSVDGFTHVEIGKMLGISENTSRSQYMRARHLLINWLEHKNTEDKQQRYAGR